MYIRSMSSTYSTKAYAKINLFLRLCGKYPNGYHRLFTLMQEVSVADDITITIAPDEEDEIVVANCMEGLRQEDDLCYKAAVKYLGLIDARDYGKITIEVKKNIPSQAGMGGGSSDAASVIKLLQKRFKSPLTQEELTKLGKDLGADVPFFFYGKSAFCEGIGEKVTPCKGLSGLPMLIVKPKEGVSTPVCFKMCDENPPVFDEMQYKQDIKNILDKDFDPAKRVAAAADILINDMQGPACEILPVIGEIIRDLQETSPVYVAMSGSGSAVFSTYETKAQRDEALKNIKGDHLVIPCETI